MEAVVQPLCSAGCVSLAGAVAALCEGTHDATPRVPEVHRIALDSKQPLIGARIGLGLRVEIHGGGEDESSRERSCHRSAERRVGEPVPRWILCMDLLALQTHLARQNGLIVLRLPVQQELVSRRRRNGAAVDLNASMGRHDETLRREVCDGRHRQLATF